MGDDQDENVEPLDFTPSHMFVFDVEPRSTDCLYETISEKMVVNGAYFVNGGGEMMIQATVSRNDANGSEILYDSDVPVPEGNYDLPVDKEGEYAFCFDNEESSKAKRIVFAVDVVPGISVVEMLKQEELEPTKKTIERLTTMSSVLDQNIRYMGMRLKHQAEVQDNLNRHVVTWSVIESFVVLAVAFAQVYYIQRLVNNRKTLL